MKKCLFTTALLVIVWTALAAYLSAHNLISVAVEQASYWLSYIILLLVSGFNARPAIKQGAISCMIVGTIFFAAVIIVSQFHWHSNQLFMHWKLQYISTDQWREIAEDIQTISRKLASEDQSGNGLIPRKQLPPNLQILGLSRECLGGVYAVPDGDDKKMLIRVVYGTKARRWGIIIGDENDFKYVWPRPGHVRIESNIYFFCGADY